MKIAKYVLLNNVAVRHPGDLIHKFLREPDNINFIVALLLLTLLTYYLRIPLILFSLSYTKVPGFVDLHHPPHSQL